MIDPYAEAKGQIIATLYPMCFTNLPDSPVVMALSLDRFHDANGQWVQFAEIYRHPCGKVVVQTPKGGCITLQTLREWVIPTMMNFDDALVVVDAQSRQRECAAKLTTGEPK